MKVRNFVEIEVLNCIMPL